MFVYIGGQVTFTAVTNIRGGDDTFIHDPITIIQQTSHYEYEKKIWTMLRLSQEINIAEVLYPDEVGIASVAPEMFCHFSLFTSSLFQDILGKLMQKENYKSLTRPLLIMHIKCSKSS